MRRLPYTIRGLGSALPRRVMTNDDFAEVLDTSDEWIRSRTGIGQRHLCDEGENTLTLAVEAARRALARAELSPTDIDLIVLATCTPYVPIPSTACFVQHALGCRHVPAFDIAAACSGFVYAYATTAHLMASGQYRHALVIGAEAMSSVTDFTDRTICILLGDGAGAAVLGPASDEISGLYDFHLGADGSGAELIWVPAGGSRVRLTPQVVAEGQHFLRMKGREVYRFAVSKMQEVIHEAVQRAGIRVEDLALVIPHQSNARIIESAAEKLGIPMSKVAMNIDRCGNTSAASIPMALEESIAQGRARKGDWVLLAGFGGGLTWGTVLLRL